MYPIIHITLPSYTAMAAIGGFVVMVFTYFRIDKYQLLFTDFIKLFACCVLCGIIGSRIVFIISRIPWLIFNFSILNLLSTIIGGGFVFYGGLLGVLFAVSRYCHKHSLDSERIFSLIAPVIPLFHAFGRIGCFMSGCCYGKELTTPITLFDKITFIRVPTQLIEVFFELLLFAIIFFLQRVKNKVDFIKMYMITYAIFRFIIEFFRGDNIRGVVFGISTSQIISIGILVFYFAKNIKRKSS